MIVDKHILSEIARKLQEVDSQPVMIYGKVEDYTSDPELIRKYDYFYRNDYGQVSFLTEDGLEKACGAASREGTVIIIDDIKE